MTQIDAKIRISDAVWGNRAHPVPNDDPRAEAGLQVAKPSSFTQTDNSIRKPRAAEVDGRQSYSRISRILSALLLPTVLLFFLGCASTTRVTPVDKVVEPGQGGFVYALPKTALDVDIPINNLITEPAKPEYAKWTKFLFGEPPTFDSVASKFSIGVPTVASVGLPDLAKVYYAEIEGGALSDSSISLTLDNRGILSAATVEGENRAVDFVVSTIETLAKVGGSVAKFVSAKEAHVMKTEKLEEEKVPLAVRRAYERIVAAMELKGNILTSMGPDLQTRLAEVNKPLEEDLALFFGRKKKETWTVQFRILPDTSPDYDAPLFIYSKKAGILAFNPSIWPRNQIRNEFIESESVAEAGRPNATKAGSGVTVHVSTVPLVKPEIASDVLFSQKKRGLHYNIPAAGTVTVLDGNIRLMTANHSFGQFGSVGFLPCSTGSRKLHQEITLDATSGALLAVKNVSNAFDSQNINKMGTAVSGALDAYDPKVKAERERDMAKARFERLDYEKKAKDIQAEMDAPKE